MTLDIRLIFYYISLWHHTITLVAQHNKFTESTFSVFKKKIIMGEMIEEAYLAISETI